MTNVRANMAPISENKYVIKAGGSEAPYAKFLEFGWEQGGSMHQFPFMRPAVQDVRAKLPAIKNQFFDNFDISEEEWGDEFLGFIAKRMAQRAKQRVEEGASVSRFPASKGRSPKRRSGDLVASITWERKE